MRFIRRSILCAVTAVVVSQGVAFADIGPPPPPPPCLSGCTPPTVDPTPTPQKVETPMVQDNEFGRERFRFEPEYQMHGGYRDPRCPHVVYVRARDVGALPCGAYAHLNPKRAHARPKVYRISSGNIVIKH